MAKRREKLGVEISGKNPLAGTILGLALRILPLLVAVLLLCWAISFAKTKLYDENDLFTLKNIQTSKGDNFDRLRILTILSEMGIETERMTLPQLPLGKIRSRFLEDPLVSEVRVRRIFPDTLSVTISERTPIAFLQFRRMGGLYQMSIDKEGFVLPGNVKGPALALPTINHIPNAGQLEIGAQTANPYVKGAVNLLNQIAVRPEGIYYDVFILQLNQADNQLTMHLRARSIFKQGARVVLSLDHIAQGLERLKHISKMRMESGQTISYIDVTYERNVPVRP